MEDLIKKCFKLDCGDNMVYYKILCREGDNYRYLQIDIDGSIYIEEHCTKFSVGGLEELDPEVWDQEVTYAINLRFRYINKD